jgi:glycosyltransferase involved in cell wall biosynthesis
MRVLFWTEQYWPYIGGLEVIATRLATSLRERGHELLVVTSHGSLELPDEDEHAGVPIRRFRFFDAIAKGNIELLFETRMGLSQLKKSFAADLVHVNIVAPSTFFHLQTANAHPCPLLVTQQLAALPGQTGGRDTVLGQLLTAADWVACCSQSLLEETHRLVPATVERSSVIYNGVDMPAVDPAPALDPPQLLCVGRLVPAKGFDVLLRAMPDIIAAHPGTRLVIAGEGPQRPELEGLIGELGLADAVTLQGWVAPEQIPHLMNDASVVVVPSRAEAFGLVALEAALMGRPVVATRVGGLPEVVEDGATGVLVDMDDPAAVTAAVNDLLADPDRRATLAASARRRGEGLFTWNNYVDAYERLYEQLAHGRDARAASA